MGTPPLPPMGGKGCLPPAPAGSPWLGVLPKTPHPQDAPPLPALAGGHRDPPRVRSRLDDGGSPVPPPHSAHPSLYWRQPGSQLHQQNPWRDPGPPPAPGGRAIEGGRNGATPRGDLGVQGGGGGWPRQCFDPSRCPPPPFPLSAPPCPPLPAQSHLAWPPRCPQLLGGGPALIHLSVSPSLCFGCAVTARGGPGKRFGAPHCLLRPPPGSSDPPGHAGKFGTKLPPPPPHPDPHPRTPGEGHRTQRSLFAAPGCFGVTPPPPISSPAAPP